MSDPMTTDSTATNDPYGTVERWQCVGWFVKDPFDATTLPFSVEAFVTSVDEGLARDLALAVMEETPAVLLEWFMRPVAPEAEQ